MTFHNQCSESYESIPATAAGHQFRRPHLRRQRRHELPGNEFGEVPGEHVESGQGAGHHCPQIPEQAVLQQLLRPVRHLRCAVACRAELGLVFGWA